MGALHVLCMDDDKNICDGIRTMVDNTGVSFASVYSGEKAVEKGKKEYDAGREYSTIILDWKIKKFPPPVRDPHPAGETPLKNRREAAAFPSGFSV